MSKPTMKNKYHYDRHGNYRGMTTEKKPINVWLIVFILVVIIACPWLLLLVAAGAPIYLFCKKS